MADLSIVINASDKASAVIDRVFAKNQRLAQQNAALWAAASDTSASYGRRIQSVGALLDNIGPKFTSAGRSLTIGFTAPVVGAGIAAVKMSSDYETALAKITGLVGDSKEQVSAWGDELLNLATKYARSPRELAESLYFVRSSGIDASQALSVVEATAKGAAAGLGDAATIAQAVTSAMNAYRSSNLSAEQATSVLVAAVREGKAEAADFAQSIGRVIPIASEMGVSFDQVAAALASMTLTGLDADEAVTALRGVFNTLLAPTQQAHTALEQYGLSAKGLREQLEEKGLLSVLQTLAETFKNDEEALSDVIPNVRALTGFLSLAGDNAAQVEKIFGVLARTTSEDLNKAFEAAADTSGFKFKQVLTEIQVELIKLGDIIGPVVVNDVVPVIRAMIGVLDNLIDKFELLPEPVQKSVIVLIAMMAAIGPILFVLGSFATALASLIEIAPLAAAALLKINVSAGALLLRLGLLVAAILAVDQALKFVSGQGLLEFFTTADERAAGATRGVEEFTKSMETLAAAKLPSDVFATESAKAFGSQLTQTARELDIALQQFEKSKGEIFTFNKGDTRILELDFGIDMQDAKEKAAELKGEMAALIEQLPVFAAAQADPIRALTLLKEEIIGNTSQHQALRWEITAQINMQRELKEATTSAAEAQVREAIASADSVTEMQTLAGSLNDVNREFEAAAQGVGSMEDAVKLLDAAIKGAEFLDPMTESLRLQIGVLEQQRRQLQASGADTSALDAQIAAIKNTLDQTTASQENLALAMSAAGAVATEAFGRTQEGVTRAAEVVNVLRSEIEKLPEQQQVEIIAMINQGALSQVYAIMELLAAGVEVPVAFRIGGAASMEGISSGELSSGDKLRLAQEGVSIGSIVALDSVTKSMRESLDAADNSAGNFARTVGGSGGLSDKTAEANRGLISLGLAFADFHEATGLGEHDFIALLRHTEARAELDKKVIETSIAYRAAVLASNDATFMSMRVFEQYAASRLSQEQQLADATVSLQVAQIQAADGAFQLREGLIGIAERAAELGGSLPRAIEEALQGVVDNIRSAFNDLFSRPTQEQADLALKVARLREERAIKKREGASEEELKAIDDRIAALRDEQDVLSTHQDVLKAQIDAADKSLLTMAEQDFAAVLYTIALEHASVELDNASAYANLVAIAQANYARSLNDAAAAVGGSSDPFSAAEKRWINGVARSRGEPEPFPGYEKGIDYVPKTGLALLHKGEQVISARDAAQGRDGRQRRGGLNNYGTVQIILPNVRKADDLAKELDRALR